jgi:hypothetical protein
MQISFKFARYVAVFQRCRALTIEYEWLTTCAFVYERWTHTKVIVSMDISVAHPNSVQPTAQRIQFIAVSCSPHTITINTTVNHSSHFKHSQPFPSFFDMHQHLPSAIRPSCDRQTAGTDGYTEWGGKEDIVIRMTPAGGLMHFWLGARILLHRLYHTVRCS